MRVNRDKIGTLFRMGRWEDFSAEKVTKIVNDFKTGTKDY